MPRTFTNLFFVDHFCFWVVLLD